MFARYEFTASYKGNVVFKGDFISINKLIKTACCFSDECVLYVYDLLTEKSYTDYILERLMEEFKNGEVCL